MSSSHKIISKYTESQLDEMEAQAHLMVQAAQNTLRLVRETRGAMAQMAVSTAVTGRPQTLEQRIAESILAREIKTGRIKKAAALTAARQ